LDGGPLNRSPEWAKLLRIRAVGDLVDGLDPREAFAAAERGSPSMS
jgi:hypothetical protein